ncbi:MAG: hypothetical protein ACM3UL_02310 [Ignavibacteria bacterium]
MSMSVFAFDQDTIGMIRYVLALQRFKEYLVGPPGLYEYLCAISFNRVLIQTGLKFPKFQKENPSDIRVYDVIRFLEQKNYINPMTAKKLREYEDFHDFLMHTNPQNDSMDANPKAQEILQFLCVEAGVNQDYEFKNRTFDEIATLRTKLPSANEKFEKLIESDFDNLNRLYGKCPALQLEIEKKLTSSLRSAQISGFTPNTGGIWIPFGTTTDNRAHIDKASIGVAFTPLDIRIGLDFGIQAHKYKIRYYEMLLNAELMKELETLNNKDTGYCLCDTFWHYHIRNLQSLQWCITLYSSNKMAIERAIDETRLLEGSSLTGNRYLISKVIQRRPEDFAYIIDRIVEEASKTLNELYPIIALIDKAKP